MRRNVCPKISLTVFFLLWSGLFAFAQGIAQTEEIAPNTNLEALGIPRVPVSLARQVKQYSGAYGLPIAGWSREKRELLLKGISSVSWVSRVSAPGAGPQTW